MKSVSGKELARNEDHNGLDSLLTFEVPEDGDYILQLRDFRYQGGGKAGSAVRLSVPIHGNRPLKTGLLRFLLKNAGLTPEDIQ